MNRKQRRALGRRGAAAPFGSITDQASRATLAEMSSGAETYHRSGVLVEAERQLKSYFDGTLKVFDIPLDFVGTEFQTSVWRALLKIPFGQTRTYTQIAKQIGHPTAARAVGAASGKNPISIMAPCHRVVGANGNLTGFAGGLETKELLLALERDGGLRLGHAH